MPMMAKTNTSSISVRRKEEWSPSGTSAGKALGDHAPRRAPLFIGENPSKEPANPRRSTSIRLESAPRAPSQPTRGAPEDAPRRGKLTELPEARPRMCPGITPRWADPARRGAETGGRNSVPAGTRCPKPVELFPHEVGKSKVIAVRRSEALFERRPVPLEQLKDDALVRCAGAVDRLSSRAPSKPSAGRGPARRAELDPVKEGRPRVLDGPAGRLRSLPVPATRASTTTAAQMSVSPPAG
jgi:hypothetical protein